MAAEASRPWKIAVEEHVMLPDGPDDALLAFMDESAIERMILAPGGTGVQAEPDVRRAAAQARESNDAMAAIVARRPERLWAYATVAMHDPEAAAAEIERCVLSLGFRGVLVNGFSCVGDPESARYYDGPAYDVVWDRMQALGIPLYLHPRAPLASQRGPYEGYPQLLGAPWGFGAETALHALRLILGGVFDRFPGLQVVLGHLGETLPYAISRTAARLDAGELGLGAPVDRVFREHFHITTSGHFSTPALTAAILELGVDRIMFALDRPFADAPAGSAWFDTLALDDDARRRIGRENAMRLFGADERRR